MRDMTMCGAARAEIALLVQRLVSVLYMVTFPPPGPFLYDHHFDDAAELWRYCSL